MDMHIIIVLAFLTFDVQVQTGVSTRFRLQCVNGELVSVYVTRRAYPTVLVVLVVAVSKPT